MANSRPVFAARGVQLSAPPRIRKENHVKLKIRQNNVATAALGRRVEGGSDGDDGQEKSPLLAAEDAARNGAPEPRGDFRSRITFDALGWQMAERLEQKPLLAGDSVDIAFTVGNNDHP